MNKVCVITGASSGIGKEFFNSIIADKDFSFDEFWVIARNADKLNALKELTDKPVKVIPLDLSTEQGFDEYRQILQNEKPIISLLINCSGFGKFESVEKIGYHDNMNMIDLNVKGTVAMNILSLEYMQKGCGIINIASVAGYQPIPYINTYGASKAFVLNFTRALRLELKNKGIKVMAVCPFWTKTEFFNRAIEKAEDPVVKKYVAMYDPKKIVKRAIKNYKKGKAVSLFGTITKLQLMLVKLLPTSLVMKVWMSQQKLNKRK